MKSLNLLFADTEPHGTAHTSLSVLGFEKIIDLCCSASHSHEFWLEWGFRFIRLACCQAACAQIFSAMSGFVVVLTEPLHSLQMTQSRQNGTSLGCAVILFLTGTRHVHVLIVCYQRFLAWSSAMASSTSNVCPHVLPLHFLQLWLGFFCSLC